MMDESPEPHLQPSDPGYIDVCNEESEGELYAADMEQMLAGGAVRTLDGEVAGDEFTQDAINYQILLGKIDRLLDRLRLDA